MNIEGKEGREFLGVNHSVGLGTVKCPYDGLSCCSICKDCGRRFCECGEPNACERMLGRGCSGTRGEGCPKGWRVDAEF